MAKPLFSLHSPASVQAALDEFAELGRAAFLARYGFEKSRDFLVRNPRTGELCDAKAIIGAAYGHQFPQHGPLGNAEFSGGEATVVRRLESLGFEVVRTGEDWSTEEVEATIASYFDMLRLEARQEPYKKTEFNADLRQRLRGRSKAAVELKHQNISSVLHSLGLPFLGGYKPRSNAQLLLRKSVHTFVLNNAELVSHLVDSLEEVKAPTEKTYRAVLVDPPPLEAVIAFEAATPRMRLPRKVDFAARDEINRKLGRAGEQWVIGFEHQRLIDARMPDLFNRLEWVSERLGDGAGYDILSYDKPAQPRYIEVKTTNGTHASSFIISRNELEFSKEVGDSFYLYRVFQFRQSPALYMLRGDVTQQLHLEPMDYRASFRRMAS